MWVNVPVALFARCAADIAGMVSHGLDSVMDKFVSTEKVGYAYEWHKCHHLRYAFTTPAVREGTLPLCQSCCQPNEKLLKCPKCGMGYCSKECQKRDWKKHKKKCALFRVSRNDPASLDYTDVIIALFQPLRIYLCPYAVNRCHIVGEAGFLLVQSKEDPIHNFLFDNPVDLYGRPLNRALTCEYLTIAEFTSRLKDNFELGVVLEDLVTAVETHDSKHQMVTLVLAPCGYINVFSAPLVPDADMCMKLGQVHKNLPLLELNIDARD